MYNLRRYNLTVTMDINPKQQQGVEIIKEYLLENQRLLHTGQTDKMRDFYISFCQRLEELMPVQLTSVLPQKFNHPIIIAANHIPTPNLFQIEDAEFLSRLNLTRDDFPWTVYFPTFIRHYPLINTALKMGLYPQVVTGRQPKILNNFDHAWHCVSIPPPEVPNKTEYLLNQIDKLEHPRFGLIIFPEGRDTEGNLHNNIYNMHPFRTGTVVIAHQLKLPILPISLAFDTQSFTYHIEFGEIITADTLLQLSTKEATQLLQKRIQTGIVKALPKVKVTTIEYPI